MKGWGRSDREETELEQCAHHLTSGSLAPSGLPQATGAKTCSLGSKGHFRPKRYCNKFSQITGKRPHLEEPFAICEKHQGAAKNRRGGGLCGKQISFS